VVISNLQIADSKTRLLVIVANTRGAEEAIVYDQITYIGFPFSISPTFQLRNTNSTLEESLLRVHQIQDLCVKNNKQLVVYLSMGFGNPYGDEYNQEILLTWAEQIAKAGIQIVSLADTVGVATPPQIAVALSTLISHYPKIEIGVHLHSTPSNLEDKLQAALDAGCKRFDSAIKGIGGCPMANDDLIGNMKTERMLAYLKQQKFLQTINERALEKSIEIANDIFAM
jgi:hydroxymethylglutaryl-CoA lyase